MTYAEKLQDPRWQKKRLQILERDDFTCQLCGDTKTTLHIHHEEYFGEPWEADNSKLKCFCKHCHLLVGCTSKSGILIISCKKVLSFATKSTILIVIEYIKNSEIPSVGMYHYKSDEHKIVGLVTLDMGVVDDFTDLLNITKIIENG